MISVSGKDHIEDACAKHGASISLPLLRQKLGMPTSTLDSKMRFADNTTAALPGTQLGTLSRFTRSRKIPESLVSLLPA